MNSTLLSSSTTLTLSQQEQEHLLEKLEVFKIQGRDKRGRQVVRVIGKIFPGIYHTQSIFCLLLYRKLRYVTRLEFLWEHVRRKEIEIPEFVNDHDAELEYRPLMMTTDYGLESDHPRIFCAPADSSVSMYYSMRCIA
ncbi:hypothetical protein EZV62_021142 [Acer yangbiense]|uniref:CRAL-TRIO domain-containing protein n=1 Tax=Acer yangbiense TaxID=1000413 RepID=A0A5C7H4M4_9ROSI|nr:hypothetical protein EZV62_021142 [Acer yangbiense]